MAFLSLIPAVGTTLVWFPVAIYFLATGAVCIAPIYTTAIYSDWVRQRFDLGSRRTGAGAPDIFRQLGSGLITSN